MLDKAWYLVRKTFKKYLCFRTGYWAEIKLSNINYVLNIKLCGKSRLYTRQGGEGTIRHQSEWEDFWTLSVRGSHPGYLQNMTSCGSWTGENERMNVSFKGTGRKSSKRDDNLIVWSGYVICILYLVGANAQNGGEIRQEYRFMNKTITKLFRVSCSLRHKYVWHNKWFAKDTSISKPLKFFLFCLHSCDVVD